MKLKICVLWLLLAVIIFAGCTPSVETITEKPGNYIYGKNEEIKIIDIATDDIIATLTITGFETLLDGAFMVPHYVKTEENGEKIYEDVEYKQLLQIYYVFKNEPGHNKEIKSNNFDITSIGSSQYVIEPDIDYSGHPLDGNQSFVVALKEKQEYLELGFTYDIFQSRKTAKIKLDFKKELPTTPPATEPPTYPSGSDDTTRNSFKISNYLSYNLLIIVSAFLLVAVLILSILLIISYRKRR